MKFQPFRSQFSPGILLCLTCLLTTSCNGQKSEESSLSSNQNVVFIEEVLPQHGSLSIPYSKYQLDNGLTIILHPDKSDPMVHVDVRYHVGANREQLGKSGFAHLFEHMMFQGSKHVGDEEHFKIISSMGGRANGEVTDDWTNYYQTVPSGGLEHVL